MKLSTLALLGLVASGASQAATFDYTGNISYHNDVLEIPFTLSTDTNNVTVWTDSYLDGLNFDPITAVWQQSGSDYSLLGQNDDNPSIMPGLTRFDSGLTFSNLAAGNYLFTIAAYNNWASGSTLSQGFAFDSQTPVALADWTQPASHRGMGSVVSVHLTGVDSAVLPPVTAPVPEPETFVLMGLGLLGLLASKRKPKNSAKQVFA